MVVFQSPPDGVVVVPAGPLVVSAVTVVSGELVVVVLPLGVVVVAVVVVVVGADVSSPGAEVMPGLLVVPSAGPPPSTHWSLPDGASIRTHRTRRVECSQPLGGLSWLLT